jgi:hypothetical protein
MGDLIGAPLTPNVARLLKTSLLRRLVKCREVASIGACRLATRDEGAAIGSLGQSGRTPLHDGSRIFSEINAIHCGFSTTTIASAWRLVPGGILGVVARTRAGKPRNEQEAKANE